MHPLSPDLSSMSDDELHKKLSDLQTRAVTAYQTGNGDLVQQVNLLINDYQMEIEARNQRMMDKLQQKNKNFGNIINIK